MCHRSISLVNESNALSRNDSIRWSCSTLVSAILCKRLAGNFAFRFGRREWPLSSSRRSRPSQDHPGRTARRVQGRAAVARRSEPWRASTVLALAHRRDGRRRRVSGSILLVGFEWFYGRTPASRIRSAHTVSK